MSSIKAIAGALGVTFKQLTGEEPGESEARVKQLIVAHIEHYGKVHPEINTKTFAAKAGVSDREMQDILSKSIKTVPHRQTLQKLAKAIYGDDATIDDILTPLTRALSVVR